MVDKKTLERIAASTDGASRYEPADTYDAVLSALLEVCSLQMAHDIAICNARAAGHLRDYDLAPPEIRQLKDLIREDEALSCAIAIAAQS